MNGLLKNRVRLLLGLGLGGIVGIAGIAGITALLGTAGVISVASGQGEGENSIPIAIPMPTHNPPAKPGVGVMAYNPDVILIDTRVSPWIVYTVENISLAATLSNLSERSMEFYYRLANMTEEERDEYMDAIANEANQRYYASGRVAKNT